MNQTVKLVTFTGTSAPDILRLIAAWFEERHDAVLIGLWSTGFGEAWELCIQVIVDPASNDTGQYPGRTLYREDQP